MAKIDEKNKTLVTQVSLRARAFSWGEKCFDLFYKLSFVQQSAQIGIWAFDAQSLKCKLITWGKGD